MGKAIVSLSLSKFPCALPMLPSFKFLCNPQDPYISYAIFKFTRILFCTFDLLLSEKPEILF